MLGDVKEVTIMHIHRDISMCLYIFIVILAASAGSVGVYFVMGLVKIKKKLLHAMTYCKVQRRA